MGKAFENEKLLDVRRIYFGMYNDILMKKELTENGINSVTYTIIRFGILYEVLDGVYIDIVTEQIVDKNRIDITRFNKFDELVNRLPEEITVEAITKIVDVLLKNDYVEEINRDSIVNFELQSLNPNNMYARFLDNLEKNLNRKIR